VHGRLPCWVAHGVGYQTERLEYAATSTSALDTLSTDTRSHVTACAAPARLTRRTQSQCGTLADSPSQRGRGGTMRGAALHSCVVPGPHAAAFSSAGLPDSWQAQPSPRAGLRHATLRSVMPLRRPSQRASSATAQRGLRRAHRATGHRGRARRDRAPWRLIRCADAACWRRVCARSCARATCLSACVPRGEQAAITHTGGMNTRRWMQRCFSKQHSAGAAG
jgi:hypothetical protein